MKRTCKNINRNRTFLNHIRNNTPINNLVNPEVLINQIWMQENTSGVKITELNSSSDSSKESSVNYSEAWSYGNNDRFEVEEDDYTVNEEARTKRRMNMNYAENNFTNAYANQYYFDCNNAQSNSNSFYDTYESEMNGRPLKHQMNCFTIINKQQINSDSSTDGENYEAIEIIELDTSEEKKCENKYWNYVYNKELVTHDQDNQAEKHTIWIYSYKNKRLLSDNDFELINIPDIDNSSTSTSCSMSDEEQKADKSTHARRMGSPIPATFIPRLDLSLVQTLSTVTELSEPNKSRSKESSHEMINFKPRNNWLTDRNEKIKQIENSNIVNWMALSPRERRRRSINTNIDIADKVVKESEITYAEGIKQFDQDSIKSSKVESSTVQVQVDIHNNEKETDKELLARSSSNNKSKPDGIKKISDILPVEISFADADNDIEAINIDFDSSNKPSLKIIPNTKLNVAKITDPIEKLSSDNWISEDSVVEKETTVYDYDLEDAADVNGKDYSSENIDSASKRLWMKNLQLMKPPQWTEYLPITDSPPSLHLSISISSINGKKSWLRRLAQCIKCCK